jgi:hypothetical protein
MTSLLDRAVTELKKRSDREQDDIARDILARIGECYPATRASAFGRGRAVIHLTDPNDDFINLLTEDDIAAWYSDGDPAKPRMD